MPEIFDEGIRRIDNKPLPIDCNLQIQNRQTEQNQSWERLHYHKYIELLYVINGDYLVNINGEVIEMPQGAMAIVNADELHGTRTQSDENLLLYIKFIPEILFSSEQTVTEMEYAVPYVFDHFGYDRCFLRETLADTFLPSAFDRIAAEHTEKAFGYELAIRAEVMRVFAWILRHWHAQADGQGALAPSEAAVMRRARDYVRAHYVDATLKGAAEYCCLSYSYFSRLFTRCMGMPFSHYVNLERVNHSMKELVQTDKSITEIAVEVGFSTASYYIQTFKKLKNVSPKQFRKAFSQRG